MLQQKIPSYIYRRDNIVRLIVFTALFALVFINIYKPFSSESWYHVSDFKFFLSSSLVILTGILVVVISRIILYYWSKKHRISQLSYCIWILAEVFFMASFYTLYTMILNPNRDLMEVFKESTMNTALVLLLPYAVLHLWFSYAEKKKELLEMQESLIEKPVTPKQNIYSFYDEKNELRLSVSKDNLLYIESADNYVNIWYLNREKPTKFMLRNSMKNIEESMVNTSVLRCHRSYIVNFEQVKVIRRQKDGIYAEFGIKDVPDIPISKTYSEKITYWFMKFS